MIDATSHVPLGRRLAPFFFRSRTRLAEHGTELPLPELPELMAGDCPKHRSVSIYDKCRVHFPQLPRLFMPRAKLR